MQFDLTKSLEILDRTPATLDAMLSGLAEEWITSNEGKDTWSPYDIIGHLIHGEKTDWIPRLEIILSDQEDKQFEAFDRFAQFEASKGKNLRQLLHEFKILRERNVEQLRSKKLTHEELSRIGMHPVFGEVSLSQLLSTWVVHDLNHIAQLSRVMAVQYKDEVGPWIRFLRILQW